VSDSVSVPTGNGNITRVNLNLTISSAYREDTGVYTCSAYNSIGNDSRNFSITVQCKFVIFSSLIYMLAFNGLHANFSLSPA